MTDAPKYLTGKSGSGPWLNAPRKTPTPPNLARPVATMAVLTAICLGAIGVGILFTYVVNDVALDRIEIAPT